MRVLRVLLRIITIVFSFVLLLVAAAWIGLQVKAASFPAVLSGNLSEKRPIPDTLPAPVERFARAVFGDTLPAVESAMVLGRARLAPTGMPMPSRFRFYYQAPTTSYYHDIQVTWFTVPFMRIHERNLQGHTTLDLSVLGYVEDKPHTNRAAIQGYWAEVLAWIPSIALTDSRIRWEAIDYTTARLLIPGLDAAEAFTVRFDPETGLLSEVSTMRYQDESRPERWFWRNRITEWGEINGLRVPVRSETQWNDNQPWAAWEVEQVALNVDVSSRLAQFGGDVQ